MYERDITFLMDYCWRDLAYAQDLIAKGDYAKSIGESYYTTFYAAKAGLLHLGIRSKSRQSVQAGIDRIVQRELLSPDLGNVPLILLNTRNEAVYRYARSHQPDGVLHRVLARLPHLDPQRVAGLPQETGPDHRRRVAVDAGPELHEDRLARLDRYTPEGGVGNAGTQRPAS